MVQLEFNQETRRWRHPARSRSSGVVQDLACGAINLKTKQYFYIASPPFRVVNLRRR